MKHYGADQGSGKTTAKHGKKNKMPYEASFRNSVYGIRRGKPFRMANGKPSGEHPSDVIKTKE